MKIIGIDPGCSGAIVVLNKNGGFENYLIMPLIKIGSKSRVNGAAVASFLREHLINHAYLEQVGAMPGQGVSSMFTFGHAAGVVEGIIQGLNIPYTLVTPQAWKKSAGLIGTDKDAARSRAIQLYPDLRVLDKKAHGQAIADAILIARHGAGDKA
ncbi:crossover junction endodeoxyribonuclease RuvC [Budviciaceae bacterium CWB-B4]|uniref:Crossover junction endodeoxyribonuclease RuvC n=1 Tax=Limnobaculum xujianqingii TaxID=2738837 RepID=A0A9D7AM88_9GAMM|nr:crossover junction endodeoxyribonuclease RuvC [Limnobaculum xujianqingii]MBK5075160.1 crossover junction endodeoxyribonuclease RuvC [Limnobaculum xujianqingii]MBK5178470.1 crossover junction endodeoxyribonuclease RuvC [Limnobaculum xujianqingii]